MKDAISRIRAIFLLYFIALTSTPMQGQAHNLLDTLNIQAIERHIETEIPEAEKEWFPDRNNVDAYEWEYARDTFRVKRVECMLFNDLDEKFSQAESDPDFWEQDEDLLRPIIQEKDAIWYAIYQETARRYDLLIDKYFNLLTRHNDSQHIDENWLLTLQQSQEAWLNYRRLTFDLLKNHWLGIELHLRLIKINENRLHELYQMYEDVAN